MNFFNTLSDNTDKVHVGSVEVNSDQVGGCWLLMKPLLLLATQV